MDVKYQNIFIYFPLFDLMAVASLCMHNTRLFKPDNQGLDGPKNTWCEEWPEERPEERPGPPGRFSGGCIQVIVDKVRDGGA